MTAPRNNILGAIPPGSPRRDFPQARLGWCNPGLRRCNLTLRQVWRQVWHA